jgi:hypothetical protein
MALDVTSAGSFCRARASEAIVVFSSDDDSDSISSIIGGALDVERHGLLGCLAGGLNPSVTDSVLSDYSDNEDNLMLSSSDDQDVVVLSSADKKGSNNDSDDHLVLSSSDEQDIVLLVPTVKRRGDMGMVLSAMPASKIAAPAAHSPALADRIAAFVRQARAEIAIPQAPPSVIHELLDDDHFDLPAPWHRPPPFVHRLSDDAQIGREDGCLDMNMPHPVPSAPQHRPPPIVHRLSDEAHSDRNEMSMSVPLGRRPPLHRAFPEGDQALPRGGESGLISARLFVEQDAERRLISVAIPRSLFADGREEAERVIKK